LLCGGPPQPNVVEECIHILWGSVIITATVPTIEPKSLYAQSVDGTKTQVVSLEGRFAINFGYQNTV
jgi:hypothetical protein